MKTGFGISVGKQGYQKYDGQRYGRRRDQWLLGRIGNRRQKALPT